MAQGKEIQPQLEVGKIISNQSLVLQKVKKRDSGTRRPSHLHILVLFIFLLDRQLLLVAIHILALL
jgi:hypothetical protein